MAGNHSPEGWVDHYLNSVEGFLPPGPGRLWWRIRSAAALQWWTFRWAQGYPGNMTVGPSGS